MKDILNLHYLSAALVYSLLGITILLLTFWIIEKITPENLWKEIIQKQNVALAILAGTLIIGISIIIASAILS
jgi:putative membrane protein